MGNGRRNGNRLNFQITANYNMLPVDYGRWQRAFAKASEILYNASEGQLSFGNLFVTNNSEGLSNAEYAVLDPANVDSRGSASNGGFGQIGRRINLAGYAQREILTILHELGHSLWRLREEYARTFRPAIDTTATLPAGHGNLIIPITPTDLGIADASLVGESVILFFSDGTNQTRTIAEKTATQIRVTTAFTRNPQTANQASIQIDAECTGDPTTGACIMEFSRDNAGTLETNGTWIPATNPVTEFCTEHNHDPDNDTDQENLNLKSCWATIVEQPNFTDFVMPPAGSGASKTAPAGFIPPQWIVLESQPRFALVLDCSGSMNGNGGSRLRGVKTGAAYWLDNAAVESDDLTIVWYNSGTDLPLTLTNFGSLTSTQIDNLKNNIELKTASGSTNIRDGLLVALNELISPVTASSLQAAVLLTDGAHNTPSGSSMLEAVDNYQNENTNIYTLGIGSGGEMDLDGLNNLSAQTGGTSLTVGDGGDEFMIQNAMMETNNTIRGGLVAAIGDFVPDSLAEDVISKHKIDSELPFRKRPSLNDWIKLLKVKTIKELLSHKKISKGRFKSFYLEIEEGAQSATFNLSFNKKGAVWMYLVDPNGVQVTSAYPGFIKEVSSRLQPYEFIKIKNPLKGIWQVLSFIPVNQNAVIKLKAFAGIQNSKISVYAVAKPIGKENVVKIEAGATHVESLTGIDAIVNLRDQSGRLFTKKLYDENREGNYSNILDLPSGHYHGYVVLRSPGNTFVANLDQIILEAGGVKNVGNSIVKHPPFVRTVPVSFFIGKQKKGKLGKLELKKN